MQDDEAEVRYRSGTGTEGDEQNLSRAVSGAETCTATAGQTKSEGPRRLMEAVVEKANMWRAYQRVVGNKGAPGVDGLTVTDLDRELENRGHRFCRYADDCNIYVRSRQAGERVMEAMTEFLQTKLKLKVNADKSAVARPWERKFLGYNITWHQKPKLSIAEASRERFTAKMREVFRRGRGQSLGKTIQQLNPVLRG